MSLRGRPPKPLEDHVLQGTFREDRHGAESFAFRPDGYAEKPKDLGKLAAWLWDFIVEDLHRKNVATKIDSIKLAEACRWYERYHRYAKAADKKKVDDKSAYRILISAKMCWEKFDQIATAFGLDPVARMRLQIKPPK